MDAAAFVRRTLSRLVQAESREPDAWLRTDYRIARIVVGRAFRGDQYAFRTACYECLGLHPDKVWPAIVAYRKAQSDRLYEVIFGEQPPKKPAASVRIPAKEVIRAARAARKGSDEQALKNNRRRSLPAPVAINEPKPAMAATQTQYYPNSDQSDRAKSAPLSTEALEDCIRFSGLHPSLRKMFLDALRISKKAGIILWPANIGLAIESGVTVRAIQYRKRRADKLHLWKLTRKPNSWTNCPKCATPRPFTGKCICGYIGSSKNLDEFRRSTTYELNVENIRAIERRHRWKTYGEYQGEHRHRRQRSKHVTSIRPPANGRNGHRTAQKLDKRFKFCERFHKLYSEGQTSYVGKFDGVRYPMDEQHINYVAKGDAKAALKVLCYADGIPFDEGLDMLGDVGRQLYGLVRENIPKEDDS